MRQASSLPSWKRRTAHDRPRARYAWPPRHRTACGARACRRAAGAGRGRVHRSRRRHGGTAASRSRASPSRSTREMASSCDRQFGGTPSNLAISLLGASNKGEVEVVAGVNLPHAGLARDLPPAQDPRRGGGGCRGGRAEIHPGCLETAGRGARLTCPRRICGSSTSAACMRAPQRSSWRSQGASTPKCMSPTTTRPCPASRSWAAAARRRQGCEIEVVCEGAEAAEALAALQALVAEGFSET